MKSVIAVYGASGFGREVMSAARRNNRSEFFDFVFIDDSIENIIINDFKVVTWGEFLKMEYDSKSVIVAIADTIIRNKIHDKVISSGILVDTCCADNAFIGDSVIIGEGGVIQPFVTLTCNIQIGKSFHANIYSYVAHDCIIGDFVTFAPGVMCNGNVHIEDDVYIGSGAIIRQGSAGKPLKIGKGAVIGMGAVVTKSVAPNTTVIGNPARPMERG
jgi:sugar O-acyltransferase (sialic acid O-acetyltransferase NeuD family)